LDLVSDCHLLFRTLKIDHKGWHLDSVQKGLEIILFLRETIENVNACTFIRVKLINEITLYLGLRDVF